MWLWKKGSVLNFAAWGEGKEPFNFPLLWNSFKVSYLLKVIFFSPQYLSFNNTTEYLHNHYLIIDKSINQNKVNCTLSFPPPWKKYCFSDQIIEQNTTAFDLQSPGRCFEFSLCIRDLVKKWKKFWLRASWRK